MSANDDRIASAERHFGFRFPQDYRDFLAAEGGMSRFVPPAHGFLAIDSVAELVGINEDGDIQERFPGAVVIGGNGGRELLAYDFRRNPPCLVLLDITAPDWSSAIYQASSLSELFEQFPTTGWKWDGDIEVRTPGRG